MKRLRETEEEGGNLPYEIWLSHILIDEHMNRDDRLRTATVSLLWCQMVYASITTLTTFFGNTQEAYLRKFLNARTMYLYDSGYYRLDSVKSEIFHTFLSLCPSRITSLSIECSFDSHAVRYDGGLLRQFTQLTALSLSSDASARNADIVALTSLCSLELRHCKAITAGIPLDRLTRLTHLVLTGDSWSPVPTPETLARLTQLQSLHYRPTQHPFYRHSELPNYSFLTSLHNLRSLEIDQWACDVWEGELLDPLLTHLTNLATLGIHCNQMVSSRVLLTLSQLTQLDISRRPQYRATDMDAVLQMSRLCVLTTSNGAFDTETLRSQMPRSFRHWYTH